MTHYREPKGRDYAQASIILILMVACLTGSVVILISLLGDVGFLVWFPAVPLLTIYLIVRWHHRNTAYRCPACGNEFEIGFFQDLLAPHAFTKYNLVCPRCSERNWAKVLIKEK
jgi:DNA-directed RNA polymerase subunit RPC12/RpoP